MNILLINHYAGSPEMGMEFRPYYMAREWTKQGHNVYILAADFSHIRRVNPAIKKDFQYENIDGINYYWIRTDRYKGNGLKRAKTMWQFISKIKKNAKFILNEMSPDAIICSSTYPLDTYAGQKLKKLSEKPVKLIHEVHDMWPLSPILLNGMSRKNPFIAVMQKAENSFCKNSDAIVSLLPASKEYFMEHGMSAEKFHHVSNGIVMDEWLNYSSVPDSIGSFFRSKKEQGKFNLCFFGSIQKTYNLKALMDAVVYRGKDDIFVTFIGPGMDREELETYGNRWPEYFKFFDPIPKQSIPDLFKYIDGTFVGIKSNGLSKYGICMNKLFDSMMGGKPILYLAEAPNNYIEDYKCGVCVEGEDLESFSRAIDELLSLSEAERNAMGENGHAAVIDNFNYEVLANKFLDVLKN